MEPLRIRPQPGPQWDFINSRADIAIYGGAAGGGKSYALLLEPLKHVHNPRFGGVLFRRTSVEIRHEGSLWDTSETIYPLLGGRGSSQSLTWRFPSTATVSMNGMEHDKDRFSWQSAQIPYLAFDEMTHFSEQVFWYMLSRNRSTSGVRPYIRGACNPDPDSWVKKFIQWFIDNKPTLRDGTPNPNYGLPIKGRCGVLRWFVRISDQLHWGFSPEELKAKFGDHVMPKSVTFIPAKVHDNKALLEKNPEYLANLMALPAYEQAQLLGGNWEARPTAGDYFPRQKIEIVDEAPRNFVRRVWYWDRAASRLLPNTDPDATVGVLMSKGPDGLFYVEQVVKMYAAPFEVSEAMFNMAKQSGHETEIAWLQDPGSAGVYESQETAKMFAGWLYHYNTTTGSKAVRAKPFSKAWRAGNVKLVRGPWNEEYLKIMANFYDGSTTHDDEVDASSGAFERLTAGIDIYVA